MFLHVEYLTCRHRRATINVIQTSAGFCFYYGPDRIICNPNRIFNLTTIGLLAVISGFSSLGAPADVINPIELSLEKEIASKKEITEVLTTQDKVEQYFSDLPIMIDIARCESRFRQHNKNGDVLRGELTPADVGVMQVNEKFHLKESKKLGYDIHTLEGNMAYARYLYQKQGARPWLASSSCWAKYRELAKK